MKWNFPSNNGGEIAGLNGSVEFFAGSPLESLAREICQNSIDAKLPNRFPTKVVFDLFTIKKEEFPNRPYFEKMIDQVKGGAAVETDWTGTIATESVQWEVGPAATTGAKAKLDTIQNELIAGTRKVFDTSKFEVNTANLDAIVASQFNAVSAYEVDGTTLTSFTVAGVDVIKTAGSITYFDESTVMSAPYFEIIIDGITVLS